MKKDCFTVFAMTNDSVIVSCIILLKVLSALLIKTIVKVLEIFLLSWRVWYLGRIKFAQTKLGEAYMTDAITRWNRQIEADRQGCGLPLI